MDLRLSSKSESLRKYFALRDSKGTNQTVLDFNFQED